MHSKIASPYYTLTLIDEDAAVKDRPPERRTRTGRTRTGGSIPSLRTGGPRLCRERTGEDRGG